MNVFMLLIEMRNSQESNKSRRSEQQANNNFRFKLNINLKIK